MNKVHKQKGMLLLFFQNPLVRPNVSATRLPHVYIPFLLKILKSVKRLEQCTTVFLASDIRPWTSLLMNKQREQKDDGREKTKHRKEYCFAKVSQWIQSIVLLSALSRCVINVKHCNARQVSISDPSHEYKDIPVLFSHFLECMAKCRPKICCDNCTTWHIKCMRLKW